MKKVDVPGRAIRDIGGLQRALVAAGFLVSHLDADENRGRVAYTRVWLDDAEAKDPTALVQGYADPAPAPDPLEAIRASRRAGTPYTQAQVDTILDRFIGR